MKPLSLFALGALGAGLLFTAGCATKDARYVESQGTETIVSLDQINIQDWAAAADSLLNSLLGSGKLERAPEQPAIMAVSLVVNNTLQQVDTDYLTNKIRIALNKSGKVITTTTIGLGGQAEDPLARQLAEQARARGEPSTEGKIPFYTLSGKLLENRAEAGRTKQVTYTFKLTLTEVQSGLAIWEDEKEITKQGKRPAVGW